MLERMYLQSVRCRHGKRHSDLYEKKNGSYDNASDALFNRL